MGEKPNIGRRYVVNGRVRIEWMEDGKRRSRTIGVNSPDMLEQADAELERILGMAHEETVEADAPRASDETPLVESIRTLALSAMDLADSVAVPISEYFSKLRESDPDEGDS
jgi:hypothetical protein